MTTPARSRAAALLLVGLVALVPAPARALTFADLVGHLSIGYAKLFVEEAPGGSLSVTGGVDAPIGSGWHAGVAVGMHLLGSRSVPRGSLVANVDYSVFEAAALLHWTPPWRGPIGRVSAGPVLFNARAELSTIGGGAGFSDLAVDEIVPGAALDVTLIPRTASPVRVGFELGTRIGFVPDETWTVATARATFHY